jgi:hypothetical protein
VKWAWILRLGINVCVWRLRLREFQSDPARPNPHHDRTASAPGKSAPASRIQPGSAIIRHPAPSLHGSWYARITVLMRPARNYVARYLASHTVETAAEGRIWAAWRARRLRSQTGIVCSLDPGNPAATEAVRSTYARLEAASLAYAKALRDFRPF